ncbi:MAG TPA: AAA family ATPase [Pirellulaceae bacterium]|jgi:predicted ATPase|nr:AAA family ATPase [Pirellulaceae bacterium]
MTDPHKLYVCGVDFVPERVESFDVYPFTIPAIRSFRTLTIDSPVTMFVGENGSGKSTLLEAIAVAWGFNPEGGTRNFRFKTRESHSELHEYLRLSHGSKPLKYADGFFFRAESFFNVATEIDRLGVVAHYGSRSLHERSHGEAFLELVLERFGGGGFYILDEPESALSPQRQLAFLALIHRLVQWQSQFIIATHSPILLGYPGAKILRFDADGITPIEYEQTEHFQVTRAFLTRRESMLREVLGQEEDAG